MTTQAQVQAVAVISDPRGCLHCHQGSCVQGRSLPTPSWQPVQPTTAKGPMNRGQLSWENAWCASGSCNFTPASASAVTPHTSQFDCCIPPSPQAWVSKWALISHGFHPLLPGRGTDAWGRPTCRGRAKTKAESQGLCNQRREREISPCSRRSSRLNPHNRSGKPCICGILEETMSVPTIEAADFGNNYGLWGQVHMGVRPDQSLSWPHNAHSGSRDLPRSTGGLPA